MAKQLKKSKSTSEIRRENGILNYDHGDMYEGEYSVNVKERQIERNGIGSYTTWDGHVYSGQWIADILSDETDVIIQYPDISSFVGTISPELQYVAGTYTFPNDSKIIGNFKMNTPVESSTVFIDKTNKKWDMIMNENELILKPPNNFFDYIPSTSETSSSDDEDENIEEEEDEPQENEKPKENNIKKTK